ncbi:MAG: phosphate acyltransferase PlsX [Candidatus Sumerlaeaceae bacterium]
MAKDFTKLRKQVVVRRRTRIRPRHAVTIALDAMGVETGPEEALIGAFAAVEAMPHVTVICTGNRETLDSLVEKHGLYNRRLQVEHASQVVGMHEKPHDSVKKTDSSVAVAARLVHEKRAGGMISAGNTGATMATCMVAWRRLPGISRPAIAAVLPHSLRPCLLLDIGANVDCKPRNLLHFAVMGSVYSRFVLHRRNPRVGLLSNGEEATKGNEMVRESHELLRASTLNFRGNAEGRDLMSGTFDVVVCDGFVGNALLKFGEGLSEFIMTNLKEEVQRNVVSQLGALAMLPALKKFKKQVDHTEYGGAPLLGLNGICVICHGSSRAKAIMNAIRVASELVAMRVNEHILEVLQANPFSEK